MRASRQIDSILASLQRALAANPGDAEAHLNLGLAFGRQGHFDQAIEYFQRALVIEPNHAEAHFNLGIAFEKKGLIDQAILSYRSALSLKPDYPEALCNLGNIWQEKGDIQQAIGHYQRALALKPDFVIVLNNLGNILADNEQLDQAIELYQRASAIEPNAFETYLGLGNARKEKGEFDHAIAAYSKALILEPTNPDILNNLGGAFLAKREIAEAEKYFCDAISIQPHHVRANWSLGMLFLLQGNYQRGLPLYEWRRRIPGLGVRGGLPEIEWDGTDLGGRRILIHAEQGFGDIIQAARYVPLLTKRKGKAVLAVPTELWRLMQSLDSVEHVMKLTDPVPPCNLHCPIMSLPLRFGTTLQSIPANVPYLKSNTNLKRQWRSRLPTDNRLKVGLAWIGRRRPDPLRTIPASELSPLATLDGVWFCNLQKVPSPLPPGMEITDFSNDLTDFADTAALMENLDLIITIDTSIAHLAGAIGRPTWLLLKYVPDWRWLLDRVDSPWYPTMRLFRQDRLGDWTAPIAKAVEALSEFVKARKMLS